MTMTTALNDSGIDKEIAMQRRPGLEPQRHLPLGKAGMLCDELAAGQSRCVSGGNTYVSGGNALGGWSG